MPPVSEPSTLQFTDGGGPASKSHQHGGAHLVVAASCSEPLAPPTFVSLSSLDELTLGRSSELALQRTAERTAHLGLPDGWMSSQHARLARRGAVWALDDRGSRNGTRLQGDAIDGERFVEDGARIEVGKTFCVFRAASSPGCSHTPVPMLQDPFETPLGELSTFNLAFRDALASLLRVAASPVSVLVLGESGTGKELIAREVHRSSGRKGRFVPINCGALSASLVEAELFGHVKGAFTGAADKSPGLIAASDGGTLFLDEIAELPLAAQVKLLRVLQEGEVLPVGAVKAVPVTLRVVAATCQDLSARVRKGEFRNDLFARIAAYEIELPPLRQRKEDLGLLIGKLLSRLAGERAGEVTFHRAAMRALFEHDWPRNVRELEHTLGVALALAQESEISAQDVAESVRRSSRASEAPDSGEPSAADGAAASMSDEELEARLLDLMERHAGNVSAVARDMGKARAQIRRWFKRFDIDAERFR